MITIFHTCITEQGCCCWCCSWCCGFRSSHYFSGVYFWWVDTQIQLKPVPIANHLEIVNCLPFRLTWRASDIWCADIHNKICVDHSNLASELDSLNSNIFGHDQGLLKKSRLKSTLKQKQNLLTHFRLSTSGCSVSSSLSISAGHKCSMSSGHWIPFLGHTRV